MSEVTHADIVTMVCALRAEERIAVACRATNALLETYCRRILNSDACPLCEHPLELGLCSNCYDGTSELGRYDSDVDRHVNDAVELKLEEFFTLDELKAHLDWGDR